ncbi:VOC family protein [Georgenia ruanii]|uniref:VOC family protein n=1 Tax=Georgenia ruanii TaxID=348442 RepID=A0A7J9UXZ8_9MICO|nr:VOC family protein [Georgenia ruanii]MPV89507.1 VOC family protein [Georgenia ruanii]
MQKIVANLWFDTQAEEAANFYVSVFGDGRIKEITHYGPDSPGPEGSVMTVAFELHGQQFVGINGGPLFPFTEAVSFEIRCKDQAEIDHYWDALVEGGQPGPCGWLKDRYGLSWQVVPTEWYEMFTDKDPTKVQRVTQAMLATQGKFDVAALRAAFEGVEQPA